MAAFQKLNLIVPPLRMTAFRHKHQFTKSREEGWTLRSSRAVLSSPTHLNVSPPSPERYGL